MTLLWKTWRLDDAPEAPACVHTFLFDGDDPKGRFPWLWTL